MTDTATDPAALPHAHPRKDEDASSGWGLWVDEFEGAEEGMRVSVAVRSKSGKAWESVALLERLVDSKDGARRWIAQDVGKTKSRQQEPRRAPTTSRGEEFASESSSANAPVSRNPSDDEVVHGSRTVETLDPRPLPLIIQDVMNVPGLIPRYVDADWSDGTWKIKITFEHESALSARVPPNASDEDPW